MDPGRDLRVPTIALDHIAIAALSLGEGVAYVERRLGVDLSVGGSHLQMGTHNCLLRLGDSEFLEVIARNPGAEVTRSRWFGLDDPLVTETLRASARIVTWIARTTDIADALRTINGATGPAVTVSRGELTWHVSVPNDGSMPCDGAFPTLIQWPAGAHPATRMAAKGCALVRFTVEHPNGNAIARDLASHFSDPRVEIRSGPALRFTAEIETPSGVKRLA